MLAVPVFLLAGAVFATANVQRSAALNGAREQVASQSLLTAMLDQETAAKLTERMTLMKQVAE